MSSTSGAHCGQCGSDGRFLAGAQNPCGWQASIGTGEVEDIKRRLLWAQPAEKESCVPEGLGRGRWRERAGTSAGPAARTRSLRVITKKKDNRHSSSKVADVL